MQVARAREEQCLLSSEHVSKNTYVHKLSVSLFLGPSLSPYVSMSFSLYIFLYMLLQLSGGCDQHLVHMACDITGRVVNHVCCAQVQEQEKKELDEKRKVGCPLKSCYESRSFLRGGLMESPLLGGCLVCMPFHVLLGLS